MSTAPKPVIVVSAPIHERGIELLRPAFEVREVHHGVATEAEMAEALADADAMVLRSVPLPGALLRRCPKLKVIAKHGAGLDSVDLETATELGIVVATSGNANSTSVAEHALTLMLAVLRRVPELDAAVRAGGYRERERMTAFPDLFGATVGIVGYGNIGRDVAQLLTGFRCTVLAYDPVQAETPGAEKVELDELLARSDIVTLHLPLTEGTRHLIGAAELERMKPGAILINTSRGGTVDEGALTKALATATIRAAGLDVFEQEPPDVSAPLFAAPNVVLSPHCGGGTELARVRSAVEAAEAALAVLRGERPRYLFNPEVLGHARAELS
ncbi:hydroxyacid dehydrogenase [Amycolatopsis ultiminotia]|uniref:Hydroxyacid dehydrogenase n=1 Tax=Amycolatopsis ultiminotia TaxID=543629 RepID=A0ABP6XWX6_9PSEU